jgi:hypothetical protein
VNDGHVICRIKTNCCRGHNKQHLCVPNRKSKVDTKRTERRTCRQITKATRWKHITWAFWLSELKEIFSIQGLNVCIRNRIVSLWTIRGILLFLVYILVYNIIQWPCFFVCLFVWWCLAPLSKIFIVVDSFIGGGNRRTRRKPSTCRKSVTNFFT